MTSASHLRRALLALPAVLLLAGLAPARAEDAGQRAIHVVERLLSQAHGAMTSGQNGQALRGAIDGAFAFDLWERYLLQKQANDFTPEQIAEFRRLLPAFLANLYRDQFALGLSSPPTVGDARKVRKDQMVSSTFYRANGGVLPVDWRVRDFPSPGPRVIDMMVAGTSFLNLRREEFAAVLQQGGPEALLDYVRSRAL